jgi:hypothetical protein
MIKTIQLASECGPFCTERTHPKLAWLRSEIEHCILAKEIICFERNGVKILTPSFIDEMVSELGIKFGIAAIEHYVKFSPPLETIYLQQIERGIRLRKPRDF